MNIIKIEKLRDDFSSALIRSPCPKQCSLGEGTRERNGSSDFYERPSNVPLNANNFSSILKDYLPLLSPYFLFFDLCRKYARIDFNKLVKHILSRTDDVQTGERIEKDGGY